MLFNLLYCEFIMLNTSGVKLQDLQLLGQFFNIYTGLTLHSPFCDQTVHLLFWSLHLY